VRTIDAQRFQLRTPLRVRRAQQARTFKAEQIEDHIGDRNVLPAHQHPLADQREVWTSIVVERDELTVERSECREGRELRQQRRHVPTAAAADSQRPLGAEHPPEAIPLDFVRVAATCRQRTGAQEHGLWEWRRRCHGTEPDSGAVGL